MKAKLLVPICILLLTSAPITCASQANNGPDTQTQSPANAAGDASKRPVPPPVPTPKIALILDIMSHSSTDGHPDLFGQFAGMQRLFKGEYQSAMKYFKIGAYYADKLSQITIGNMYLNGRGVPKNPATACAWITLAAERGYPNYLQARDHACKALGAAEHAQAMAVLATLEPEYGDAVAKRRMRTELRNAKTGVTGSRVGYDFGVRTVSLNPLQAMQQGADCTGQILNLGGLEVPRSGCGRYDPELFDATKYFAARDAQWFGTVTVGVLQNAKAPAPDPGKNRADDIQ